MDILNAESTHNTSQQSCSNRLFTEMHYLSLSCLELEVTASTLHLVQKAIGTNAGQYEVTGLPLQNQN